MDVYLLPVGPSRYELYCEVADEAGEAVDPATHGVVRRLVHRFQQMIKEAEGARREGPPTHAGWSGRARARALRWVAESIAEQRLLWHLRSQDRARLFHPDDLDRHDAERLLRIQLTRDVEKHRFWLVIDLAGFIVSGLLALIPGPNLVAYYFAFRLVGHYLSMRGARRGLHVVSWSYEASQPLTELRHALALEPSARAFRVRAVADTLQRSAMST
jgi:hypothetical protein